MRHAWLAFAVVACTSRHDATRVEVRSADCAVCHDDKASPHEGRFPDRCGECHTTTAWLPALEGFHPGDRFPIDVGGHQGIACTACHDAARGSSVAGANTSCTGCHTGAHTRSTVDTQHTGVPDYAFDAERSNFCLTCHPSGQARRHEEFFPIKTGHHRNIACTTCHNEALGPFTGGANTDCVGCHEHTRSTVDDHHREVRGYVFDPANPHFCLQCHPRGTRGP
jgi:hypothetical protein